MAHNQLVQWEGWKDCGVLASGARVCVSTFWEMSPCSVIPAAPRSCFPAGLVCPWP